MKVIFLDIDDVLNTSQTFIDIHNEYIKNHVRKVPIDLHRLILLKRIVDETKAVIIMSSSHRKNIKMVHGQCTFLNESIASIIKLLNDYGLYIYDITPQDESGLRQNEITTWLQNHNNVESFVVIDDDSTDLTKFLDKELIKTSWQDGLTEQHVEKAIKKLNLKKPTSK